jgi:hypothetical protein
VSTPNCLLKETRVITDSEKSKSRLDYPQSRNDMPAQVEFEAELSQPPDTPPEVEFRLTNTRLQRPFYMGPHYLFDKLASTSRELCCSRNWM